MNNPTKLGIIIAAAILLATGLYIFFSPYQSCVRAMTSPVQRLPARACSEGAKVTRVWQLADFEASGLAAIDPWTA